MDEKTYQQRLGDWRYGQIIYQIHVDRFATSPRYSSLSAYYQFPRKLMTMEQVPAKGEFNGTYWTHELEFWGGDLPGIVAKIDYLVQLGINVVYLNPIFTAYSNHKYDTSDYTQIDPAYGTMEDLRQLSQQLKSQQIKLVLDGVFNHMGIYSPWAQEVMRNPASLWREFFQFKNPQQLKCWWNLPSLPELKIENPRLQRFLFDEVILKMLGMVDGWRLDVAFLLGEKFLQELTLRCHRHLPQSLVIGEIWNYLGQWGKCLDGIMNFHLRELIFGLLQGKISGPKFGNIFTQIIEDAGIDAVLKSWNILNNHDTARLPSILPHQADQYLAWFLNFTLPGSPLVFYGDEINLEGGVDPANRAMMKWDGQVENQFLKQMIKVKASSVALKIGDYLHLITDQLLAFARVTPRMSENRIVIVNPGGQVVTEMISLRDYRYMHGDFLIDEFTGHEYAINCGFLAITLGSKAFALLRPKISSEQYDNYHRIDY